MLQKNMLYEITIEDIGVNGEGIGRIEGFTVFVEGGLPSELLEIRIVKLKKNYGYGKLLRVLKTSPDRIQPACPSFPQCGGCALQHLAYPAQLHYKKKKVVDCLCRLGGFDPEVLDTIGMELPFFYRNKAQFPIGLVNGMAKVGVFANRSHRIIPVTRCMLHHTVSEDIILAVERFLNAYCITPYDEEQHTGLARHLMIRVGFETGEIMVCLVINGNKLPHHDAFVDALMEIRGMAGILLNFNTAKTNVIMGAENSLLWGKPYIIDSIGSLHFEISPHSFFQVNPMQTKILYELVLKLALADRKNVTIIDAYCGIGTISLFLALYAVKVYGIEAVPEAIADANRNAERNGIHNVEFVLGAAEEVIVHLYQEQKVSADVIVVDPPRKGCDIRLLHMIREMAPERIIYVSCDPATLARDMRVICEDGDYNPEVVQPMDCFCWTGHVETVVLMSKK